MRHHLLALILFVTLVSGTHTQEQCPTGCACNVTFNHAKCTTLSGLIRFDSTSSFQSLDLSNIGLRKITSHLDKFTNLVRIDLSGNRLSEVNKLPKGITDLNLSNNRITSAKLAKIPKSVVNLNLSENHITYVPHSIMTLKYLRHLELSGNPINCTCDTLAVRNWLKAQHVWTDRHITCVAPLKFKGRPWLQMKQAEVCEVTVATKKAVKFESKYNWDEIERGNELMQGDQAHGEEGSGDHPEDDDVLENDPEYYDAEDEASNEPVKEPEVEKKDFALLEEVKKEDLIPVHPSTTETPPVVVASSTVHEEDDDEDYKEGSGDTGSGHIPIVLPPSVTTEQTEPSSSSLPISSVADDSDDYDDEGSGASVIPVIPVISEASSTTESDITFEPESDDDQESSTSVTLPDLNIFQPELGTTSTEETPVVQVTDNVVVVGRAGDAVTEQVLDASTVGGEGEKANVQQAKTDDSKNTFILLGILGILLVCLIVYVAIKDKSNRRNRRNKGDLENGSGKEMKEMSKDLLGKEKGNGHPSGNNYTTPEKRPLVHTNDEKPNGHSYPAISPNKLSSDEIDTPITNASSPMSTFKPIQETPEQEHEAPEPNNNQYPPNGDLPEVHHQEPTPASPKRYSPVYTPRTPKLGNNTHLSDPKYSPVYSPETGRVKVKATETPRPKTPVLVTRTKSSAGDYITTTTGEVH